MVVLLTGLLSLLALTTPTLTTTPPLPVFTVIVMTDKETSEIEFGRIETLGTETIGSVIDALLFEKGSLDHFLSLEPDALESETELIIPRSTLVMDIKQTEYSKGWCTARARGGYESKVVWLVQRGGCAVGSTRNWETERCEFQSERRRRRRERMKG